jgi:HK97 gp10 family phage protein
MQNFTGFAFSDAVDVVRKIGDQVAAEAKSNAPYRTGRLQGSIHSEQTDHGCRVRADAPYAGFVNGGTRRMAARPYFTNALNTAKDELLGKLEERLEDRVS